MGDEDLMRRREWFVIRTKPSMEEVARVNFENQGFSVYLPMMSRAVSHARRKKLVRRPVFPGYLFLHLAPDERDWHAISATRGTLAPVRFGNVYVPVPDWVIEGLKQKEDAVTRAMPLNELKRAKLAPGMEVEVEVNRRVRTEGLILSFNGQNNVMVLLNLLGREVRASIPLERVERKWG
jgi:transcriptional antiterminator RfaH